MTRNVPTHANKGSRRVCVSTCCRPFGNGRWGRKWGRELGRWCRTFESRSMARSTRFSSATKMGNLPSVLTFRFSFSLPWPIRKPAKRWRTMRSKRKWRCKSSRSELQNQEFTWVDFPAKERKSGGKWALFMPNASTDVTTSRGLADSISAWKIEIFLIIITKILFCAALQEHEK